MDLLTPGAGSVHIKVLQYGGHLSHSEANRNWEPPLPAPRAAMWVAVQVFSSDPTLARIKEVGMSSRRVWLLEGGLWCSLMICGVAVGAFWGWAAHFYQKSPKRGATTSLEQTFLQGLVPSIQRLIKLVSNPEPTNTFLYLLVV